MPKQRGEHPWVEWLKRAVRVLGERLDAIVALVASFALGLAGAFGWITSNDHLAAATLLVLSVIGVALVIERSLRLSAKRELEQLREDVGATSWAIKALHAGRPYHLELDEIKWDIAAADGSVAYLDRMKKLVFDYNDACSLYDFSSSDGTEEEPLYEPGEKVDVFTWAGERYSVISLGRMYMRGEPLDFRIRRTVRDAFPKRQERVTVETREFIMRRTVKVSWPTDRGPHKVSLLKTSAHGVRQIHDIADRLETNDGRLTLTIEVHEPEAGSQHTIEWEW